MGFADDVAAETFTPHERCKTCDALAAMPDDLRAEVEEVMASAAESAPIARALTARGYPVGESTVRKHRRDHVVR